MISDFYKPNYQVKSLSIILIITDFHVSARHCIRLCTIHNFVNAPLRFFSDQMYTPTSHFLLSFHRKREELKDREKESLRVCAPRDKKTKEEDFPFRGSGY